MDSSQAERLDEQYFRDSNWVAFNGGYIHANNVLFYFAESPFFDRQSSNSSVFQQALSDYRFQSWLATRENFEAQLRRLSGLEYVVAYDPLAMNVQVDGPNGKEPSNVWVIKKQNRQKRAGMEDQITVLAYYYIVGDAIYQAPSVAKVIANRMLSTVTSLTNLLSTAAPLPVFAPSYGHTYFPPVQKPLPPPQLRLSQASKENTPMPEIPNFTTARASKSAMEAPTSEYQDLRTLVESINISLRYGKEYMDDTPLVGEPGNFRLSKMKEPLGPPVQQAQQLARPKSPPKEKTPTPAPTPLPPIQTDVPPVISKKSAKGLERSPTTPGEGMKARRRKSKAAISSAS